LIGALLGLGCGAALAETETEPWVALPTPHVSPGQTTFTTVNFGGHQWIVVGTEDSPDTYDNNVFDNATASNGSGINRRRETLRCCS
jgi:hypothetical protein